MAMRRARALAVPQQQQQQRQQVDCRENDENVNPMAGDEVEHMVQQERHVLVRCQPRRHPRIPLRDITHLFPGSGNVAYMDDKTISLFPPVQQAQGNGPVRRPLHSASLSSQNSRKRRQPQLSSETTNVRRVLPKFR